MGLLSISFLFEYSSFYLMKFLEPEDKEEFIRMQLYDTSYEYFGPKTWPWPKEHISSRTVPSMDENICLD